MAEPQDIACLANERECEKIHTFSDAEMGVGDVLLGKRRRADVDTGQVDAFAIADLASGDHFAASFDAIRIEDLQLHRTVGDEDGIAGLYVAREIGICGRRDFSVPFHLLGGDGENSFLCQETGAVLKCAEPDFGALQIEHDAGVHFEFSGEGAYPIDAFCVVFLRAVGCVQAEDIDAGFEQFTQHRFRISRRAESGHNFGSSHE